MPNRTLLSSLALSLPLSLPLSLIAAPALAFDPFAAEDSESSSVSRIVDGEFDLTVKTVRKTRTLDDGSIETTESVEMKAMRDGKEIPQDRIRRTGNRVEILDENGAVIHSAVVSVGPMATARTSAPAGPAAPAARPMLGVTLEATGEPLVKHLRLEPGRSTLLTSIMPESPAAKAGLETFDVVTAIGDREDASPESIREFLSAANVGDEVRLAIVRAGERREVKVTLEAMSAAMAARNAAGEALDPDVRAMLEELRARGIDIDLGGALGANQGVIIAPTPNAGGGMRFIVPPGGGFAMPGGGPDFAEFEERMRRMQEEMERAMQRLERMRPVTPPAPVPVPAPAPPAGGREA